MFRSTPQRNGRVRLDTPLYETSKPAELLTFLAVGQHGDRESGLSCPSQPYKWQAIGFNLRNQLTGEQYVIPTAETGLGGAYVYGHGFSAYTGTPASLTYPVGGGLFAEKVTTTYDAASGLPKFLDTNMAGVNSYVVGQQYTGYGEPTVTTLKIGNGVYAEQSVAYELDTRRVHEVTIKPETSTGTVADRTYNYDPMGKIKSVIDAPQVGQTDNQCFIYDQMRRLTSAWTPKTGVTCGTAPSTANLGGPAPYWLDWTIDSLGNRTKQVSHATTGDTTRDYAVPTAGLNVLRPHAVIGMTTTVPGPSSTTVGYNYDAAGNMTSRPSDTGTQTITWDVEGNAVKIAEGTKVTTSLFDTDGTRLIRRDNGGSTLYLPGQEIRRNVSGSNTTMDATRYYAFNGSAIASRTVADQSLTWLFADHQGTQQVAVNAYTQQVTIRRQTPYGDPRGTNAAWPNGKGFVGGDLDPTGLTHVGAREYDPALGRFISVDPVQDLTDPQQWNAYSYCGNDPVSQSDPSGTRGDDLYYGPVAAARIENNAVDEAKRPKEIPTRKENRNRDNGGDNNSGGGGGGSTGQAGNGSTGGGEHHAKPKQKHWWERTGDWVGEHKNQLIGAAVGIVAFVGCEAVTSGVGTVGCMAVAGAAANITTGFLNGNIHNAQDLASSFITGAAAGILAVPLAAVDMGRQASAIAQDYNEGDVAGGFGHGALAALDVVTVVAGVKALGGKGGGGCLNSFAPATLVLLDHGVTKPISEIRIGDQVVTSDPQADDASTTLETVEALHDNLDSDLVDVTLTLADGRSSVIHTTEHHPFWDQTTSKWVDAGELNVGHRLRDADGNDSVAVSAVAASTGVEHMLNLTVTELHTYFVLAGNIPVLVHNCPTGNGPLRGADGRFETNPSTQPKQATGGAHGNSLDSTRPTALYQLKDSATGAHLKWGITSEVKPMARYPGAFMRGKTMDIIATGDRRGMEANERFLTSRWPGPLNKESWAGSISPSGPGPFD